MMVASTVEAAQEEGGLGDGGVPARVTGANGATRPRPVRPDSLRRARNRLVS
jgi:hypothetical protein